MSPAPIQPNLETYAGRFAFRLRTLREKTGMTGKQFADALQGEGYKLTTATYYRWESGESQPPLNALPKLAELLGQKSPRTLLPLE